MIRLSRILEDVIGRYNKVINVEYLIDMSSHSHDRQYRHVGDGIIISPEAIAVTVNKGIELIMKGMIADTINVGDAVLIHNDRNGMNIVGSLSERRGTIIFTVITVMVKHDFKAKAGTKVVNVV